MTDLPGMSLSESRTPSLAKAGTCSARLERKHLVASGAGGADVVLRLREMAGAQRELDGYLKRKRNKSLIMRNFDESGVTTPKFRAVGSGGCSGRLPRGTAGQRTEGELID
jgi:hypothetical protein